MKNKKRLQRRRQKQRRHRKVMKDTTVSTIRRLLELDKRAIRNPDGSIARGNKKLETLQKEYSSR